MKALVALLRLPFHLGEGTTQGGMVPLMTTDRAGATVRGSAPRSAACPAAGSAGGSERREPAAALAASGFSLGSRHGGRPRRPGKLPWAQSSLRSGGEIAVPPYPVRRGTSGAKPCSPWKAQPGPRPGAAGVTTPAGAAHTDRGRPRSSGRRGGSGPGGGCSLQVRAARGPRGSKPGL